MNVFADIDAACGMDGQRAQEAPADESLRYDVNSEAMALATAGVNSVPSVLLNRHLLFSGAQSPERIADTLRRALAKADFVVAGAEGLVDG